jgi:hypothetical protein
MVEEGIFRMLSLNKVFPCSQACLNSERAIEVNILIIRAFVKLREMIASHKDLGRKLDELEKKYDGQFQIVFEAIRQLMAIEEKPKRKIGFQIKENRVTYKTM